MGATVMRRSICFIGRIFFAILGPSEALDRQTTGRPLPQQVEDEFEAH
jgi:hypothetical protein